MDSMKILIIEDEKKLAALIQERLIDEKYEVNICTDGDNGLYEAQSGLYDLIILDVMLPGINGFEILRTLRQNEIATQVIMLTAKGTLEDKLEGLHHGADDYITKPFHMEELIARVHVRLFGHQSMQDKSILFEDLKLEVESSNLVCVTTQSSIPLMKKEFLLMDYFMRNPNQILSRDQLFDRVWGEETIRESNNVEAYISFLRKKMKAIGSTVQIKAVRGLGYTLKG